MAEKIVIVHGAHKFWAVKQGDKVLGSARTRKEARSIAAAHRPSKDSR